MKVDLHCHSYYSDGKHSPLSILQFAADNQVTHLSITDHDSVAAYDSLGPVQGAPLLLPGVEISCDWNGVEIHVVGILIDLQDAALRELLGSQQASRRQRFIAMDGRLQELAIPGLAQYLDRLPCESATRSHVADFLVERGVCRNRQKAFKHYLRKGGKIHVPSTWCSMQTAITTIVAAAGIATLAHPSRYPLGRGRLETLVDDFKAAGGSAIEASYGNLEPNVMRRLCELATTKKLYISAGSDFHDAAAHWTGIGKYPAISMADNKNAIWQHPRWHSFTAGD